MNAPFNKPMILFYYIMEVILQHNKKLENFFHDILQIGVEFNEISKDKDLRVIANLLLILLNGLRVLGKIQQDEKASSSSLDTVLSLLD